MRVDSRDGHPLYDLLCDRSGDSPPYRVWQAAWSLVGDASLISAAVADSERTDAGGTRWLAICLTDRHVIVVDANSPEANWDMAADMPGAREYEASVVATMRPLGACTSWGVDEIEPIREREGTEHAWSPRWWFQFGDERVSLPLFPVRLRHDYRASVERVARQLLDSLMSG